MTTFGTRPNGIYVARFRNVKTKHPGFLRGYGFQAEGYRKRWMRGAETRGMGAEFKDSLIRDPVPGGSASAASAKCLPRQDNFVSIHPTLKDKWGIPALHIQCTWGTNELAMLEDMQQTAAEMLEAGGATHIETFNEHLDAGPLHPRDGHGADGAGSRRPRC